MISKIKENFLLFFLICSLIIIAILAVYDYKKSNDYWFKVKTEIYEKCQINNEDEACNYYTEPVKQRDTITTLGYITLTDSRISTLQILSPLLIMLVASYNFFKKLKKGYFKNSLTRISYKKSFLKLYLSTYRYTIILPIFLIVIFICSYFISGNFDYEYGSKFYMFDVYGIENCKNIILFMIVYLLNFILHSIFWINISIYNCKHNKSFIVNIIFSYIEYLMIFIIFDMFFAGTLFGGTEYSGYFSLSNIWAFSGLNMYVVLLVSFILAGISTFIVFLSYKNKEKVLEEI